MMLASPSNAELRPYTRRLVSSNQANLIIIFGNCRESLCSCYDVKVFILRCEGRGVLISLDNHDAQDATQMAM